MTDQHTANYDLDENEDYYDGTSSLDRFHYSQLASSSSLQKSPRTRLEQQYDLTMQIDDDGDAPAANKNDFPQLVDDSSECISFPPTPCKREILHLEEAKNMTTPLKIQRPTENRKHNLDPACLYGDTSKPNKTPQSALARKLMQMTRELSSEAAISRFQRYFSPTKHRRSINDGCTANAQQQANCSLDETTEKERRVCFIFSSENPLGKVLASCWGVDMIQLADGPKNAKVLVRHGTNIPKDFKHFYCIE